ncbi:MAG: type II toxin-antitoxin system PemK/MazF family toxin [Chloroflexi bacterium]|nr:type II toxin-antitoxin system PemK/MazF family toxin [Chloroflexota bacterium]
MSNYDSGEIVLVEFPFTSGESAKRRPAIVLLDTGDSDVIVARVTSQEGRDEFDVELKDWKSAGLLRESIVRVHKLATLEKTTLARRMGKLSERDWASVKVAIDHLWQKLDDEIRSES